MNKQIINQLLLNGKRSISEKILLQSIKLFDKSFIKDYKNLINCAVVNLTPLLKIKQLKQKNKRLQKKEFPFITNRKNRISLAIKFFLKRMKTKKEIQTYKMIVTDLVEITTNSGKYISKKKDLYEYACLKKKYFYYR